MAVPSLIHARGHHMALGMHAGAAVVTSPPQTVTPPAPNSNGMGPLLSNWNKSYFFTPAKFVKPTPGAKHEIQAVSTLAPLHLTRTVFPKNSLTCT